MASAGHLSPHALEQVAGTSRPMTTKVDPSASCYQCRLL
jgi:hypothetical protein